MPPPYQVRGIFYCMCKNVLLVCMYVDHVLAWYSQKSLGSWMVVSRHVDCWKSIPGPI